MVADDVNPYVFSLLGDSDHELSWKPPFHSIFSNELSVKGTSHMFQIIPRMLGRGICVSKYSVKIITGRILEKNH